MLAEGRSNLVGLSLPELAQLVAEAGEPAYRAVQIADWVYRRGALSWEDMTDLPGRLRQRLAAVYAISLPQPVQEHTARDGTRKYLLRLADGETVEAVAIAEGGRLTACISSQVGCAVGCPFCATGQAGFRRQLVSGEIVGQVMVLQKRLDRKFSNIVFMGMGEPLLNYENVLAAVGVINHQRGLGVGARRITLSTAGVVPGIRRLAQEPVQINLAVSLHASRDDLRDRLVPLNKKYPLADLMAACRNYIETTNRRITFEYVLIRGCNDSPAAAHALGRLLAGLLCHVNLIPVNPVGDEAKIRPAEEDTSAFARIVQRYGVETTARKEKGTDIAAACGQLRQRLLTEAGSGRLRGD